jgi:hypothetical protein
VLWHNLLSLRNGLLRLTLTERLGRSAGLFDHLCASAFAFWMIAVEVACASASCTLIFSAFAEAFLDLAATRFEDGEDRLIGKLVEQNATIAKLMHCERKSHQFRPKVRAVSAAISPRPPSAAARKEKDVMSK